MTAAEAPFFDGKCPEFIEGYRFVPAGESWTRPDGVVFHGEMVAPWVPYPELDAAQREYEWQMIADLTAQNVSLVNDIAQLVEEVYQSDLEMMTE